MVANGLQLGGLGVFLYFMLVGVWSVVVAYVITFASGEGDHGAHAGAHSGATGLGAPHTAHAPLPVEPTRAKPFRGFSPYEGFKSYAQGDVVTIDDIVFGLARESGATELHNARVMHDEAKPHAHQSTNVAPASQANAFLELLVSGERDGAFAILRDVEEHGEGAESFLKRTFTAVESALEARIGGGTCDMRVMEILGRCDTPVLEKLVSALATADGDTKGGKLALTRAFGALK